MAEGRAPYGKSYTGWIIGAFVLLAVLFVIWFIWQDHYEPEVISDPNAVIEDRPVLGGE